MPRALHNSDGSNYARRGIIPPDCPRWITEDLVESTIRVWQPYYRDPLSVADAIEILRNFHELVAVLRRL